MLKMLVFITIYKQTHEFLNWHLEIEIVWSSRIRIKLQIINTYNKWAVLTNIENNIINS